MKIEDYLKGDKSGYGSHLPALKLIFDTIEINFALELGMGMYSTPFLLDHVTDKLTSIEMQDKEWFDKVVNEFYPTQLIGKCAWEKVFGPMVLDFFEKEHFDLVLVDGSSITRAPAAAHYMEKKVETIVCHDTESPWYAYHLLKQYADKYEYFEFEYKKEAPWTRIYTINKKLINELKSFPNN